MGHIIILNGIVGKSSTAKAMQAIAKPVFFHVPGDAFLDMLPQRMWGASQGITFATQTDALGRPAIEIEMGGALDQLMDAMRRSVAAMAQTGANLIVDDVMLSDNSQLAYRSFLADADARFVGLHAPLEVLEAREKDRGDRAIGLARWQWGKVHRGIEYDLELDTTEKTSNDLARAICDAFNIPLSD